MIGGASAQQACKPTRSVCDVSGGLGLIIGSQKSRALRLPAGSRLGPPEPMPVRISKFGLAIGATTGAK